MKKLTIRYIRYALALLANVGFKLSANDIVVTVRNEIGNGGLLLFAF